MTYLYYSILGLVLLIIQTTIIPEITGTQGPYDLIALIIFYLGLYQPFRQSLPMVFILGFIMDNLSGAPFGIYITTYFWVFVGVSWVARFLRVRNIILLPLLLAAGILVENIIFIGTIFLIGSLPPVPSEELIRMAFQILWAVVTGPFLVLFFRHLHSKWDVWILEMLAERSEQNE